jgi:hypothetical protein
MYIRDIVNMGMPTVFYITGGGSGAISTLLQEGGASSFFLEAQVPYDSKCVTELLGGYTPDKFCSQETSSMLAVSAYKRASMLVGSDDVVGVGVTCKLCKYEGDRKGRENVVYITIHGKNKTMVREIQIHDIDRRAHQESEVSGAIVTAYCNFLNVINSRLMYSGCIIERDETISVTWALDEHTRVHMSTLGNAATLYNPVIDESTIFSGSFNPIHDGHIKVAERAYEITGRPVWFEISLDNCSKPTMDWVSLHDRSLAIKNKTRDNKAIAGLLVTKAPLFTQKARIFSKPTFVVGRDTVLRVDNPAFYNTKSDYSNGINELVRREVKFLVFDRLGSMNVPFRHCGMDRMCTTVDDYSDNGENSTDLRRNNAK